MTGSRTSPPDRPLTPRAPPGPEPPTGASTGKSGSEAKALSDSPLAPIYEINERCIKLLTDAARNETRPAPGLIVALRPLLLKLTPDTRVRAAQRALLLLDMGFRDALWWKDAQRDPQRASRTPLAQDAFPARAAMNLARSTLVLSWHGIRADRTRASLMLGISRPVTDIIASLTLTDLDRIAERRFRRLRPRWEDRPALWRRLLLSVETADFRREREFNLRALQLVTGELALAPTDA